MSVLESGPRADTGTTDAVVRSAAVLAARYRRTRQEQVELALSDGQSVTVAVAADQRFDELVDAVRAAVGDVGVPPPPDGSPDPRADAVLLADAVRRPRTRVGGLRTARDEDADRWVAQANADADRPRDHLPLHVPFERVARSRPDLVAVEFAGTAVSYGDLDRRADRMARALRAAGVGVETRVAVLLDRSVELVVALLGIWKAGGAFVPLDPRTPAARIDVVLADTGAPVVVTDVGLHDLLEGTAAVRLGVPGADATDPYATDPHATDPVDVPLGAAAFVYYTSGSTGAPKGAVTDHRCAAGRIDWLSRRYGLGPGDRVVHKTPLIFDVAVWEVLVPLGCGATVSMADARAEADVEHVRELLSRPGTVLGHFVPSMLRAYLDTVGDDAAEDVPVPADLRWVQVSGEAVPGSLLTDFAERFDAELHNLYGQSETSEVAAWEGRRHDGPGVPIGRRIGVYRLFVLDDELRPVPPGVPGELHVAGVGGLARGYHGRPDLTAERFVPNPFAIEPGERLYRTGDLVVADRTGELTHLGRLDEQVKIRGARVEPAEVEAALAAHPAVRDCVVLARPEDGELELVAYVVAPGGERPTLARELGDLVEAALPRYLHPAAYVLLPALPVATSGKLDRAALPAPTAADRDSRGSTAALESPLQERLAGVWRLVLGIAQVGPGDSFYSVGGDSLKSLQLLSRVNAAFGIRYSVRRFFADPTLRGMAAGVEEHLIEKVAALSEEEAAVLLAQLTTAPADDVR